VCSSSVEFCELAQWVAVPEWEEGSLVLIKQTFVGPLDVLDGSARLRAVTDVSSVCKMETLASSRESSNGSSSISFNKFLSHSLAIYQ